MNKSLLTVWNDSISEIAKGFPAGAAVKYYILQITPMCMFPSKTGIVAPEALRLTRSAAKNVLVILVITFDHGTFSGLLFDAGMLVEI